MESLSEKPVFLTFLNKEVENSVWFLLAEEKHYVPKKIKGSRAFIHIIITGLKNLPDLLKPSSQLDFIIRKQFLND